MGQPEVQQKPLLHLLLAALGRDRGTSGLPARRPYHRPREHTEAKLKLIRPYMPKLTLVYNAVQDSIIRRDEIAVGAYGPIPLNGVERANGGAF